MFKEQVPSDGSNGQLFWKWSQQAHVVKNLEGVSRAIWINSIFSILRRRVSQSDMDGVWGVPQCTSMQS